MAWQMRLLWVDIWGCLASALMAGGDHAADDFSVSAGMAVAARLSAGCIAVAHEVYCWLLLLHAGLLLEGCLAAQGGS